MEKREPETLGRAVKWPTVKELKSDPNLKSYSGMISLWGLVGKSIKKYMRENLL